MLAYERINISDGINVNKSDELKQMYAVSLFVFFR